MTLREGLDEYYAANPGLLDPEATSTSTLGAYMNNHDVSHVVFGTDTSLRGEMVPDLWTFLAIDVAPSPPESYRGCTRTGSSA